MTNLDRREVGEVVDQMYNAYIPLSLVEEFKQARDGFVAAMSEKVQAVLDETSIHRGAIMAHVKDGLSEWVDQNDPDKTYKLYRKFFENKGVSNGLLVDAGTFKGMEQEFLSFLELGVGINEKADVALRGRVIQGTIIEINPKKLTVKLDNYDKPLSIHQILGVIKS